MHKYKAIALGAAAFLSLGLLPSLAELPATPGESRQEQEGSKVRFFIDELRSGKKKKVCKAETPLVITDILISTFEQTEVSIWVDKELVFKHYIGSYRPLAVNLKTGWKLPKGSTLGVQIKNGRGRLNITGYRP